MKLSELKEETELCACYHLRRASRKVTLYFDDALQEAQLKTTQFTVLVGVGLHEPINITQLAETIGQDMTGMSRNVKILMRRGLLEYAPSKDKRSKNLCLSVEGKAILEKAYPLWKKAHGKVLDLFGLNYSSLLSQLDRMEELYH